MSSAPDDAPFLCIWEGAYGARSAGSSGPAQPASPAWPTMPNAARGAGLSPRREVVEVAPRRATSRAGAAQVDDLGGVRPLRPTALLRALHRRGSRVPPIEGAPP